MSPTTQRSTILAVTGRSDPTSDLAINFIEKHGKSVYRLALKEPDVATIEKFMSCFDRQTWSVMINLLLRKWFSRVWTFQEACLPKNTISLCGKRYFSDFELAAILPATFFKTRKFSLKFLGLDDQDQGSVINNLSAATLLPAWWGTNWDASGFGTRAFLRYPEIDRKLKVPHKYKWLVALEVLVHEMRQRECSEAKDKIIAPLTFARSFVRSADYEELRDDIERILGSSMSQDELFIKFTRFMMTAMGNIDILSRVDRHRQFDRGYNCQLPSWVPDFSFAGNTSLINDILHTQFDAARKLTGEIKPQILLISERELRVNATYFDEIKCLSKIWTRANRLGAWFTIAENCAKPSFSHKGNSNLMYGTVIASPSNKTELKRDIFSLIKSCYSERIKRLCRSEKEEEAARHKNLRMHLSTSVMLQLNIQIVPKTSRRLFCSSGQKFRLPVLGLAPMGAKKGDKIFVLRGARVPFILRKVAGEKRFQAIGEAYVDGIMRHRIGMLNHSMEEITLV